MLTPAFASAQDYSPFLTRGTDQYDVFSTYAERVPPDSGSAPEEALQYISALDDYVSEAVASDLPGAPAALQRLDPYLVHLLGYRLGGRPYGTPLPTWCALWADAMVPRFAADAALFASEPTADHAALVLSPVTANIVRTHFPYRCEASNETWDQFTGAVSDVLAAAPVFLETAADGDSLVVSSLRRSLGLVQTARPFIEAEGLRRSGRLAAAQSTLERATANHDAPYLAVWAAGRLARSLSEAGHTDAALAVLDRAAPLAPAGEVPADTVRSWYTAASAAEAARRYAVATAGPALVPTGRRVAWAEGLVDLETGEPFDPASLGGRPVLLDVWATWCGNCIADFPDLVALAEERGDEVAVVAVSVDAATGGADLEEVRETAERHGLDVVTLYDPREAGSLADVLEIGGYPARFFFGPDGEAYTSRGGSSYVVLDEVEAFLDTPR